MVRGGRTMTGRISSPSFYFAGQSALVYIRSRQARSHSAAYQVVYARLYNHPLWSAKEILYGEEVRVHCNVRADFYHHCDGGNSSKHDGNDFRPNYGPKRRRVDWGSVATTNTGTGLKRTVTSDAQGRYVVPNLAPGTYELSATTAGFETLMRQGITLTIGQSADLDLSMKVGAVTEQVTVMEEAPLLNTSSSAVSSVVEEKRIQELPLNGRDFSQLPLIQAGVAAIRNGDSTITKGYGARVSMGGSRPDQTAWLLDGTNIHNLSNFGTPGSAAGVMLGVDAVREFQVLTSNYSAELGGTSGGVVNMVSKSGTNGLHGTAYEFLRNSKLDARNFFDKDKPPFKRNQFGASIGGPIKKDKAFFFGNYEGLRQRQQVTSLPKVLDASVHQGLIPDGKGNFTQVQISPAIKPYLDLWPLPTSNILSNGNPTGIGILSATASSPVTENFFVIRGDVHLNEKQSLFGRVNYDQSSLSTPDTIPLFSKNVGSHSRYVTLQHDYIVSGTFLMTTRLAYNRSLLLGDESALFTYPDSLNIFQPGWLPALTVTGTDGFGPNATNQLHRPQNVWDFAENLQDIHGSHSMKFGFEGQRVDATKNGEVAGSAGAFTWDNIQSFLTDGTISAFGAVSPGSARNRTWFQKTYGLYFQDDWKWRPNFTWNLGIRYEPYSSPTEKHDRVAMVRTGFTIRPLAPTLDYSITHRRRTSLRVLDLRGVRARMAKPQSGADSEYSM